MAAHKVEDIRNVAIVGHAGAGKTTLGEAILLKAGVTNRLGSVDDGSSVLDYDDEAKERGHSLDSSVFHVKHGDKLLNFIDTPGMPDYCGPALASLIGVETALIAISAAAGIGTNTRRMFQAAGQFGLARMIVITRIDAENANLEELYSAIHETFGHSCRAINLPAGGGKSTIDVLASESGSADILDVAQAHTELIEAIVETDEDLMEAYMADEGVPQDKLRPAIAKAVAEGSLIPVLFADAGRDVGIQQLLDEIVTFAPSPAVGKQRQLAVGEGEEAQETPIAADPTGPFVGQVFKVLSDPKSNIKYSVFRVFSGTLPSDGQIVIRDDRKSQRAGHVFKFSGGHHDEADAATAGDIAALAKIDLKIGDMLWDKPTDGAVTIPRLPSPMYSLAIEPKARGDIEKVGAALTRFSEEDPCFQYHRNAETNQLLMSGLGDQHLTVIQSKMKRYFKLEVDTKTPKIPYRETISGSVKYVEYTHKKQTGGAGQFARVFIDLEPNERGGGYEFIDKIFGGAIDQPYRPAVDKGIQGQMKKGVIAGCPVVDVKVSLVDGKTHPVDSKDIAFQVAGRNAFKKAFMQCKPILLEPIVTIEVHCPTDFMGDIQRDLAGKRGQIEGQDMLPGGQCVIKGKVPLAEVSAYASQLKSVTGGQGSYIMDFSHYDVCPPNVQQEIQSKYQSQAEQDED